MKIKTVALSLVVCLGSLAQAQNNPWNISASVTAVSKYVGGTGGALFSDKPCLQTNINFSHKSGYYLNFWRSVPLEQNQWHSFCNETDWQVGYNTNVCRGRVNLDVSAGVYDLVPTTDLYPVNLTLTATSGRIRPYAVFEHDFAQSDQLPAGDIYKVGCRGHNLIDWDVAALGNVGSHPYGGRQDYLSGVKMQLSQGFLVRGGGTLIPAFTYYAPLGHANGLVHNQAVFSLCYVPKIRF